MKHSIANYPLGFVGCVVSPTKICLQFSDVTCKLRVKEGAAYVKLPNTSKALPIAHTGTEVDVVAVGCQMPELEALQGALIEAYIKYGRLHKETYHNTYSGKEFLDFLKETHLSLGLAIELLKPF